MLEYVSSFFFVSYCYFHSLNYTLFFRMVKETKKEIKEDGLEDTFLYKYGIAFTSAELVPEPENPHDPNAIKVIADGVFVGHVPAKESKAVRKIMDEKKIIKTECQIYGGDYKVLDYDSSSIRKGSTNLKAVVSI